MSIKQTYQNNNVIIKITEDEDAYFYALKDDIAMYIALKIRVVDINNQYATSAIYHVSSEIKCDVNYTIKQFLSDPVYRRPLLTSGTHWDGTVEYTNDRGINIQCSNLIESFNRKRNKKFSDYMALKTFGKDSISKMRAADLLSHITSDDNKQVSDVFTDESSIYSTFRWILRGISVDDAIHKTKIDIEIQNNKKK